MVHLKGYLSAWLVRESVGKPRKHIDALHVLLKTDMDYVERLLIGIRSKIVDDEMTSEDMKKCNSIYKKYRAISNVEVTLKDEQ